MDFGKILDSLLSFFSEISAFLKGVAFVVLVVLFAMVVHKQFIEEPNEPVNVPIKVLSEKEQDIKIMNEKMFKVKWDSVLVSNANLKMENSINNRSEIKAECRIIKERLNHCNYVSYWMIHNNGEPIDVNGEAWFLVLLSSSENISYDYRKSQKLPSGYFELAKITIKEGVSNYSNVMAMPLIASGTTRQRMNNLGTKSIMTATVSESFTEWYFVTFSFSKTSPDDYNTDLRLELSDFRRYVEKRKIIWKNQSI